MRNFQTGFYSAATKKKIGQELTNSETKKYWELTREPKATQGIIICDTKFWFLCFSWCQITFQLSNWWSSCWRRSTITRKLSKSPNRLVSSFIRMGSLAADFLLSMWLESLKLNFESWVVPKKRIDWAQRAIVWWLEQSLVEHEYPGSIPFLSKCFSLLGF